MTPFVRAVLAPVLILFAAGMALMVDTWTTQAIVSISLLSGAALLGALWLISPKRFGWAGRVVAALVFLAYSAYLVYEFIFSGHEFRVVERSSNVSPRNALLGFVIIGLPCLWYALGKPTFGRRSQSDSGEP